MQKKEINHFHAPAADTGQKLLVGGLVRLERESDPESLERGMSIWSKDGEKTGIVAAVVWDLPGQEVTHFLLGYVPPTAVYHLVPLCLIDKIDDETVWLRLTNEEVTALPIHQPDSLS